VTLSVLLARAGVSRYDAWIWFRDAILTGQTLRVAPEVEPTVRKCYLERFRLEIPALALVMVTENRPSVFRTAPARALSGRRSLPEPQDLFSEAEEP